MIDEYGIYRDTAYGLEKIADLNNQYMYAGKDHDENPPGASIYTDTRKSGSYIGPSPTTTESLNAVSLESQDLRKDVVTYLSSHYTGDNTSGFLKSVDRIVQYIMTGKIE